MVDDHDVTRAGLRAVIESDLRYSVVAAGTSIFDGVAAASSGTLHGIVLSLDLPGVSPPAAVARLLRAAPRIRVVGVTGYPHPAVRTEILAAGAARYLTTGASAQELLDALAASTSEPLEPADRPSRPRLPGITERELEVLELISMARSTQAIAESLGIAEGTARRHINNMYRKLRVGSRVHAVSEGRRLGLLA